MITQFPYVSLENFRWILLSRDRLLLLLFHAAILFGPFQCETIVCTAAQSFQYKYGASKTLPSKKEDDVTCETTAQRMMRFNNGDRSENRERICPKDVEYLVQTIVDDVATSICPLEDNSLNLTIYASLPSYSPNLATVFSWIVIGVLRDLMPDYQILSVTDIAPNNTMSDATASVSAPLRNVRTSYLATLNHVRTFPTELYRTETTKLWQYDFIFAVCWGTIQNSTLNTNNVTVRTRIEDKNFIDSTILKTMTTALSSKDGLQSLDTPAFLTASNYTLKLSLTELHINDTTSHNDSTKDTLVQKTVYMEPQEENQWGWRQYAGLVVFIVTTAVTTVLLYMSSKYQRRRMHKELWGNLGTEEGVDALLQIALKVGDDRMKFYNKGRWGYNDDDSLFMGGYQQCDPRNDDNKSDESSDLVVDSYQSPTPPAVETKAFIQEAEPHETYAPDARQ